jgi:hypothetical protein
LFLFVVGCGARTELLEPEAVDASTDSVPSHDATPDVAIDVPIDTPIDVPMIDAPMPIPGCADGTREGFTSVTMYPAIAACSGGFRIPGVMPFNPGKAPACPSFATHDTVVPACNRTAGNDGPNPSGTGCSVADLCELGWHVCTGANDVASHSPTGCSGIVSSGAPPLFFVTRQSSNGCTDCATGTRVSSDCNSKSCTRGCAETASTSNDVFGCGNFGTAQGFNDCGPLDHFSNNLCGGLASSSWTCTDDGSGFCEAYAIAHLDSSFGGALCCKD